jgi:type IV secretion system protein VirB6
MIDYNDSIIGTLFTMVDTYSAKFVGTTYHNLVSSYSGVIYTMVTLYFGFVFISMKRGILSGADLPFIVLKVVSILTFAMNYDYFYLYIYNVFTNGPLELCKAITLTGKEATVSNITDALDNFISEGFIAANKLFSMGGWSNALLSLFGAGVFLATLVAGTIATGLIFLSKIASSILLAISPLFIVFALYDSTKGWFDSYIQHLFTYALIPVMACAVMMITLSVTETTIEFMSSGTNPSLKLISPFMLACAIQVWLFLQVPQKCASLASGFNLKSFTASMRDAGSAISSAANGLTGGQLGRALLSSALKNTVGRGGGALKGFIKNRMSRYKDKGK